MANTFGIQSAFFSASPGDVITICRPGGFPPWVEAPEGTSGDDPYERNGFVIVDRNLGKFIGTNAADDGCVDYKHEKSGKQIIQYLAGGCIASNVVFEIIIQPTTVHDHASVYQGGPAFATYYAKTPQEE